MVKQLNRPFVFLIFVVLGLLLHSTVKAQSYNINNVDGTTVNVLTASTVYFYDSGGATGDYGNNEDYTVTFSSENGQPLLISFTEFDVEGGFDFLYVYDGTDTDAPLIGQFSGNNEPGTVVPTGADVTFVFISDNIIPLGGFAATITSMDSEADVTTCSGSFTDKQGGGDYSPNQYYKVTYYASDPGKNLLFEFNNFRLNGADRLLVYDGTDLSGSLIGTYTGNGSPGTIISSGEALTFVFMADDFDENQERGWEAAISCFAVRTFYSYDDNYPWNDPRAWTLSASGDEYDNPDDAYPTGMDKAVILNGKAIQVTNTGNTVTQLEIREGGVLDLTNTGNHDFGTILGKGRMRATTSTLPDGVYTLFTQSGAGTIELYGNTTASPQLNKFTFNNLEINSTGNVIIEESTQINGNLTVGSGNLLINSPNTSSVTVEGDILVSSGGVFGMGNTNANRSLYVNGDFENEGTVTFTSETSANYTNNPDESVDLYFVNDRANQLFTCNGPTTLNRLIVDKGTDDTYMLDVNASATDNFRLFGRNDADYNFPAEPPNLLNEKALEIYAGTLRLGSNISIPRLLTTDNVYDQYAFVIDQDAALILDGATVNVSTQTDNSTIIVYGKLKVIGNSTFTSLGRQGIILREYGVVEVEGNPTITTTAFRTSSRTVDGAHRGTLTMSGGTLTITGNNRATSHPAFALPFPDNTLQLSGGIININHPTYYDGTNTNESWLVSSNNENVSVTGGTVNIYANGIDARINSTAPFYNLNLISNSNNIVSIELVTEEQQDETVTVPAAPRRPLTVLNDFTVEASTTFLPNNMNVTVGGDFTLNGTYTPGNNTTTFNAYGIQAFANAGNISGGGMFDMVLENGAILTVANNLNVRNNLTINAETTLRDGGNAIGVDGDIVNSGKHQSATGGSLVLTGTAAQNISGNGLGIFGNLSLNKASGSTLMNADMQVLGDLRLGGTAAVLDIGSNKLALGAASDVYNDLTGTNSAYDGFNTGRMIQTDGTQSAAGLVKNWNGTGAFTYPVGSNGIYTPAEITLNAVPDAWGSLSVNGVDNIHPLATDANTLNYYWNVTRDEMTGFTSGDAELRMYYDDSDVVGDISQYVPAYYYPVEWTFFNNTDDVSTVLNQILFDEITDVRGHFTAGEASGFGEVAAYYSNTTEGSWDDLGSWSYDAAGTEPATELPGENSPVIIQSGHTINVLTNDKLVGSLTIEEDAVLDIGVTTGHFFGLVHESTVSGTGTLRITADSPNALFPGGDFGEFLGKNGGTVEYYTTGTDFTMPMGDFISITMLDEGFEGSFPPTGWSREEGPNDGVSIWGYEINNDWERTTAQSNLGTASARHLQLAYNFFGEQWSDQDDLIITPPLNFTDEVSYQLSFWRYNDNPADYRYQGVWVSTTNTNYESFTEKVQELGQGESGWVEHTVDLSDYAGEETVYIAFVYQSYDDRNSDDVYIDDVVVTKRIGNSRYHNLVLNPEAGQTITLPNADIAATGVVTVKGSGTAATSDVFAANVSVADSLNIQENGILRIDNQRNFTLSQNGPVSIASGGSFVVSSDGATAQSHRLNIFGDVENNGTLQFNPGNGKYADLYFKGTATQEFSGTGTNNLYRVYVDKGSSQTPLADVTADNFALNTGLEQALFINNGTIRFSGTSLDLTLTTNQSFTIPQTGCLSVNGSTVTLGTAADNSADLYLSGKLEVLNGIMNVGNMAEEVHNDIEYATAGAPEISVSGGALNVNGQIRRATTIATGNLTYRQLGGEVNIYGKNRDASQMRRGLLEVLNSGQFISSGGVLTLANGVADGQGDNTYGELYLDPASSTVTGGTVVLGNSQTDAAENVFNLYLGCPVYNLTVNGTTTAKEARLRTFEATLNGNLTIEGPQLSVFNANNVDLNVAGDMLSQSGSESGSFLAGDDTQQTTFIGQNQTVYKVGTGSLVFGTFVADQASGGVLTLEDNTVTVKSDIHLLSGSIEQNNNNNIEAEKNVYLENGFSVSSNNDARLTFNNETIGQYIYTDGSGSLGRIHIAYNNGVRLEGDLRINNRIDFPENGTPGRLNIDKKHLTLGPAATIGTGSFAPGEGRYILLSGDWGDAGVTKEFTSTGGSFLYPIGVGSDGGKYTPALLNLTSTGGSQGTINVKAYDGPHPSSTNENVEELQYFWRVSTTGFTNPVIEHAYTYADIDIAGNENNYVNAFYDRLNNEWHAQSTDVDVANNTILFDNPPSGVRFTDGDYTAGLATDDNFGEVDVYYSAGDGSWSQANSWRLNDPITGPQATVEPKGNPVIIQNGHIITCSKNGAFAGSVTIESGARLDVGTTTEHNIGLVSGAGTIRVASKGGGSFIFPGGDFTEFMNTTGSTVEYDGSGTLPASVTTYQNVTFLGNAVRTIPAINILVLGDLHIVDGTLTNSTSGKKIEIEGNWISDVANGFDAGLNTVIFSGSIEQTLTSAGGGDFYNFQVNKTAGSLTLNDAVEVNRVLTLTSGIVNTTATELLTVHYSQSTAVQGGSATAYINGPLRRNVNSSSSAVFPVGKDGRYGEMEIFGTNTAGTQYWTAEYFNTAPIDATNLAAPLQLISNNEFWSLQGVSGAEANLRLRWDDQSAIIPAGAAERQKLRVAQYLPPWTKVGETVNDVSQSEGTVETLTPISFDGTGQDFTLGLEQTASAEITSGNLSACDDGTTFPVTFNVTGDAPLEVVLQINGAYTQVESNLPEGAHTVEFTYADLYAIAGSGDYVVTISSVTDNNGLSGVVLGTGVTLTLKETPAPVISGPTSVQTGSTTTFSVSETTGNTYAWSVTGLGTIDDAASSTINITWGSTTGTATLTLTETNPNGCSTTVTYDVEVRDWPVITGNFNVCAGSTETYSTRQVGGHTYNWSVEAGTIISGGGTYEITVQWSSQAAGNIILEQGPSGGLITTSQIVTINPMPTGILSVDGSATICDGETITLNFGHSDGGAAPAFELFVDEGSGFTHVADFTAAGTYETAPLVWSGPDVAKTVTYGIVVTNTTTGCVSEMQEVVVTVYKIPETGETYHISNEHAK